MTHKPPVNLSDVQLDKDGKLRYACFLPALSRFYGTYIAKQQAFEFVPPSRMPAGFDRGIEGMNYLNAEEGYFTYKYGLYSAGHAQLNLTKSVTQESMIQQRDRNNTIIVGDSGGFQIGKGIIKFDWLDFEGTSANKIRQQILDWLELTADWSMMLDVPAWAADKNHTAKTGLKTFEDCLEKTRYNNKFFLDKRQGHTKFLNVLQGNDWETAETWYDGVKEFSDTKVWGDQAAEGWAFGGANMCKMDIALKRLMTMREDGLLENKDWIHFLGTGQLDWACYLTSIQRQLRKHINEEVTVSFDCASPFVATAHGLVYTSAIHTAKRWGTVMEKAPDNKALSGNDTPFPFESEFGRRLTVGDVCHYAPGVLNKINKVGKTSWDSFSYALLMGHNVYCHITAVQRANQLMDIECAKGRPDWRHWTKLKSANSKADESSLWVPRNILYFDRFVEELFNTTSKEEAFLMIKQAAEFLRNIDGSRMQGGTAQNKFGALFDVEEVTTSDEIDFEDSDDEALNRLSEDLE